MIDKQNLPLTPENQRDIKVKKFFDRYFLHEITFPAEQIDAVVGYFVNRGFDELAAKSVSIVLLTQSRIENINIFKILETLKGLTDLQLSNVVAEILNSYREKTSSLGFKDPLIIENYESRNIRQ
jgi:hypothetical protein